MIKTSRQLKDKIKNLAHGDSLKSQTLLRTYMMERFLERLAVSQYNSHFVLKGGMLVSSMVGIHQRATMDIDATVVALPLTLEDATRTIQEIVNIDLQDGVVFSITNAESIMEEHDYPGLRFTLIGTLDGLRQKVKIDISTGDAITPQAIEYRYPLMFEKCQVVIINKIDSMPAFDFDMDRVKDNIAMRNPEAVVFPISARTGEGMDAWCEWLKDNAAQYLGENQNG